VVTSCVRTSDDHRDSENAVSWLRASWMVLRQSLHYLCTRWYLLSLEASFEEAPIR
jgi:hypothetical protein